MRNSSHSPVRAAKRPLTTRIKPASLLVRAALSLSAASSLHAATLMWDVDGDNTNGGGGGAGIWNLSNTFWFDATNPTNADIAWPNTNADIAVFDGAAGAVTLGAPIIANGLTFNVSGYTLSSSVPANTLTLDGTTPTITVTNAGHTATINSPIAGTVGFSTAGAGTLVLAGSNTFTGATTVGGTGVLKLTNVSALGASGAGNGTTVSSGATLQVSSSGTIASELLTLAGTGAAGMGGALVADTTTTWSGAITIGASGATINTAATANFNTTTTPLVVTGNLSKSGSGILSLGAVTSGSGTLTIDAGTVTGNGAAKWNSGNITINSGGTYQSTGAGTDAIADARTITVNSGGVLDWQQTGTETLNQLTLNGTGIAGAGAFVNNGGTTGGVMTFTAGLILGSAATIGGTGTLKSATALTGNGFTLTKNGTGNFTSTVNAGTPFGDGSIVVNGGTLQWAPASGGSLTLTAASAAGATFSYAGGATLTLTKPTTLSQLTIGPAGAGSSSLVRSNRGTLILQGTTGAASFGTANERVLVNGLTSAANINGMYPGSVVIGNGSLVATAANYSGSSNGFIPATYTSIATGTQTVTAGTLADFTAATTLTDGSNPYSIRSGFTAVGGNITNAGTTTVGNGSGNALIIFNNNAASANTALSISGGTLAFGAAEATVYASGGTASATISSTITGSAGLTKFGVGNLILGGTNTSLTGGIWINQGSLQVSADANLGATSSNDITFAGGSLKFGAAFNPSSARAITLNAGGGTIDTNGNNATVASNISGVGNLTKAGTGTLTLSGTNNYTGYTFVNAGVLQAPTPSVVPNLTTPGRLVVASGATFAANVGGAGEFTSSDVNSVITLPSFPAGSAFGFDTTNAAGGTFTYNSVFPSSLIVTKLGTGTLALTGGSTITTLNINTNSTVDIGSSNLTISNAGSNSIQSSITSGTATVNATGGGTLTLSQASATDGPDIGVANGGTLIINAKIVGSSGLEFFRTGVTTGVLVLGNSANTYTGNTIFNAGIISVDGIGNTTSTSSYLGTGAGALSFSTGTLRYTGTGETTDRPISFYSTAAANGGTIDQSGTGLLKFTSFATPGAFAGTKTLTLTGSTTGTGEISAPLINNGSTLVGVTKTGTGTWTLSGNNTASGTITVNGANGLLLLTGDNTGSAAPVTITAGTLRITAPTQFPTGTLTLNGGTLDLRADSGTNFGKAAVLGATSTINVDRAVGGSGTNQTHTLGAITQVTNSVRVLTVSGANGYSLNIASFQLNPTTGNNSTVTANVPVTIGSVSNPMTGFTAANFDTLFLDGTDTVGSFITGNIADAPTGSLALGGYTKLTKQNTGTWTISGNPTYTGATAVNGGVLNITGGLGNTAVTVAAATLNLNNASAISQNTLTVNNAASVVTENTTNALSGTAALTQSNGVVTLSQQNNFSGATTFSGGTLNLTAANASGTSAVTTSGGTLKVTNINALSTSALTLGGGTLQLRSDGDDLFSTASTSISATTTINVDQLTVAGLNKTLSLGAVNITAGATTATVTINSGNGYLFGVGALSQTSATGGTVGIANAIPLTIPSFTTSSNGTPKLSFTGAGNVTITGNITQTGTGALGLDRSNTAATVILQGTGSNFTGPTTITNGTIQTSVPNGFGSTSGITIGGSGILALRADTDTTFGNGVTAYPVATSATGATINVDQSTAAGVGQVFTLGTVSIPGAHALNIVGGHNSSLVLGAVTGSSANDKTITNGLTGTGTLTIASYAESDASTRKITFNGAGNTTVTSGVTQNGVNALSLTYSGTGTLTLNGTSTYTGTTSVNAGTLKLGSSSGLNSATALVVANGTAPATFDMTAQNQTVASVTFGGATGGATGQGSIITGSGTLTLGGNVTYTSTGNPLGASISGLLDVGAADRTFTINDSSNAPIDLTIGARISSSGGSFGVIKAGAGVLALTGSNFYTGNTTVNAGVLRATDGTGLPGTNLTLNGGVFETDTDFIRDLGSGAGLVQVIGGTSGFSANGAALNVNLGGAGATVTWGGATFAPSTLVLNEVTANNTLTFQNPIDLNGAVRTIAVNAAAANSVTINTLISSSTGTGGLTKSGVGTLVLGNAANSYNGATSLNGGILSVGTLANGGVNSSIGAASNAQANLVFNGGVLKYTGGSVSIDRSATLSASGGGVEVTTAGTNLEFASNIVATTSNKTFTKTGAGTLTLSGTGDNSFLALVLSQGTVILNKASGTTPKAVSAVSSVAAGTTLQLAGTGGNQIANDLLLLNGTFDMNGRSEGVNVFTGGATGLVTNGSAGTISTLTIGATASSFAGNIQDGVGRTALGFTASGGTLALSGTNTFTGGFTQTSGYVTYAGASSVASFGRNIVDNGGIQSFNFTGVQQYLVSAINGTSTGVLGLTTANAAENIDFSAANGANQTGLFLGTNLGATVTYTGTFTPHGTTYRLGGGGTGSVLTIPATNFISDNGSTPRSLIAGGAGGGTLDLTSTNSYTGGTTLAAGTLGFVNGALGSGNINVTGASTLRFDAGNTQDISNNRTLTLGAALTVDTGTNNVTFGSPIGNYGSGGLTKAGAGVLTLNAANPFTGATTINAGAILLGNANALRYSAVTTSTVANGLTFATGIGSFVISGLNGTANLALTDGTNPVTLQTSGSGSYTGVLSGAGGLTKLGYINNIAGAYQTNGVQIIGKTQTYTGATTLTGTISPSGSANDLTNALALDFSNAAAPAAGSATGLIDPSSALILGGSTFANGGTLEVKGKATAGAANSQTFASTTVNQGSSFIRYNVNGSTPVLTANLQAITRNAGGTIDFQTTGTTQTTAANNAAGILGGWATVSSSQGLSTDWATVSGGAIATYSGYTNITASGTTLTSSATSNVRINAGATVTTTTAPAGTTDINTLAVAAANTAASTVTIGSGNILRLGAQGGILVAPGAGILTIGTANVGTLTAGGAANTAGEIVVNDSVNNNQGQNVVINSVIANNGTGVVSLVKTGFAGLTLGGTNTYNGGTVVNMGRISVAAVTGALGRNSANTAGGDVTVKTGGQIFMSGGTWDNNFSISGIGTPENIAFGAIRADASTLTGTITLVTDASIGNSGTAIATVSGKVTGPGTLVRIANTATPAGTGILTVSNINNDFTGGTLIVSQATVRFVGNGTAGGNAVLGTGNITIPSAAGAVTLENLSGYQSILNTRINSNTLGAVQIALGTAAAGENINTSSTGANLANGILEAATALTYTGTYTPSGNVYRFGFGGGTLAYAQNITGSASVVIGNASSTSSMGTGTAVNLTGTNTYTGGTTLNNPVSASFASGSLGTGPITFASGSGLIWNAGNTDDITANGRLVTFSSGTATLTISGTTTFANVLGNMGAGNLVKAGSGTLTLSAGASYTGNTTINNGTLVLGVANALPRTALSLSTASGSGAALTLGGDLSVGSLASTGTFAAGNGNINIGANTLTIGYDNSSPNFYAGISGTGSLVKLGTGTQTLVGPSTAALSYTGGTTIRTGTINLNFSDTVAPGTNILPAAGALTIYGGTLQATGKASTTNSQTFTNGITLAGGGAGITASANATSNPLKIDLGTISRNAGSTVNFTLPTGTASATNGIFVKNANSTSTILAGWATVGGTNWAVSAGNGTTSGLISALASGAGSFAAGGDVDAASGANTATATAINSLRYNTAAAANIDSTAGLTITTGGILIGSTTAGNTVTFDNGTITSGGPELIFILNNTAANGAVVNSKITGNIDLVKTGGADLTLNNAANDFTGAIFVGGGRIILPASSTIANAITINPGAGLTGVGAISSTGTTVLNGAISALASTIAGDTFGNSGGSLTINGAITAPSGVFVGSRLGTIIYAGGGNYTNFRVSQDTTKLGATNGIATNATADIATANTGTLDLNGFSQQLTGLVRSTGSNTSTLTNSTTTPVTLTLNNLANVSSSYPGTVSGPISIVKNGAGVQIFAGTNSFVGDVTVNTGTLTFSGALTNTAANNVTVTGGTLNLTAASSLTGALNISGGSVNISAATAFLSTTLSGGTLTLSSTAFSGSQLSQASLTVNGGTLDLNGINNLSVGAFSGTGGTITDNGTTSGTTTISLASNVNASFAGSITNGPTRSISILKEGTGKLNLAGTNTATGLVTVQRGTLLVSGSISGTTNIAVGATLSSDAAATVGPVRVATNATDGGTLAPGETGGTGTSSVGVLTVNGSLNLGSLAGDAGHAHLSIELGGTTAGTEYDRVVVSGGGVTLTNVTLDGSLINSFLPSNPTFGSSPLDGSTFYIVTGATSITGTFVNATGTNELVPGYSTVTFSGQEFAVNYSAVNGAGFFSSGGNDIALMAIPEPGSFSMLAAALGATLGLQRFRRRRK